MTEITSVLARRVWDSRGRPTVEVEVRCGRHAGRAIAPAGASAGRAEAVDLRDGGSRLAGLDVATAVGNVNHEIAPAILGMDPADQEALDTALVGLDGTRDCSRLGGNALIATSMANAHAAAAAAEEPLWQFLDGDAATLPMPEIQVFGGGAHAGGRIDIQDLMIVPLAALSFDQCLEWAAEIHLAAGQRLEEDGRRLGVADEGGWWPAFVSNEEGLDLLVEAIEKAGLTPGKEVGISIDVAASQFGRNGQYELGLDGRRFDTDGWCEVVMGWLDRYPIVSVEDPVAEDDVTGLVALTKAVGDRVQVVADDFVVTDAARIGEAAARGAANAVLVKPNQAGTVTGARRALEMARRVGYGAIASARSGESEDVTIVHLAVGWGVPQLKVGSMARGERTAKWNEALRIEALLGPRARLASFPFRAGP